MARMAATASLAADAPSSSLPRPLPVTIAMRVGSESAPSERLVQINGVLSGIAQNDSRAMVSTLYQLRRGRH